MATAAELDRGVVGAGDPSGVAARTGAAAEKAKHKANVFIRLLMLSVPPHHGKSPWVQGGASLSSARKRVELERAKLQREPITTLTPLDGAYLTGDGLTCP